MTPVSRRLLRTIVDLATEAPSLHNTQPWRWRLLPDGLELRADRDRWLRAADPEARSLVLSCGTALHHARAAARSAGWEPRVTRWPVDDDPWLLARVQLDPSHRARAESELWHPIATRRTDRRRFTSWPVPDQRLQQLADLAEGEGTRAVVVGDERRGEVEELVARSLALQAADPEIRAEQARWVDRSETDGVPSRLLPDRAQPDRQRYGPGDLPDRVRDGEPGERWLVLADHDDDRSAWLRAGEGLSACWLAAERSGLALLPLSHPVEHPETREALRAVIGGVAHPLLVVRVGWPAVVRDPLPDRPRRALSDVIDP